MAIGKFAWPPEKLLEFHIWYLKEKGLIHRSKSGGYAITAKGVDIVEENDLILERNRILPEPSKRFEKNNPKDDKCEKEKIFRSTLN